MSDRQRLPNRRLGLTWDMNHNGFSYSASVGLYDDGSPGEVFLSRQRSGDSLGVAGKDVAIITSLALQHGVKLSTLQHSVLRDGDGKAASVIGQLLDEISDLKINTLGDINATPSRDDN